MSHTQVRKTKIENETLLARAAEKLDAKVLGKGEFSLYAGRESGFGVQLPGFRYPVVLTEYGELKYDTYNGRWGDDKLLQKLEQHYSIELVKDSVAASFPNAQVEETWLENGELELNVIPVGVGGGGPADVPPPEGI